MACVAGQMVLAAATILTGSPVVGLVACGAMGVCMVVAVVTEIVAFYRVGTPVGDPAIGRHRAVHPHPTQASW